jgi:hypothetical protein
VRADAVKVEVVPGIEPLEVVGGVDTDVEQRQHRQIERETEIERGPPVVLVGHVEPAVADVSEDRRLEDLAERLEDAA